jgi:hypothetical protein
MCSRERATAPVPLGVCTTRWEPRQRAPCWWSGPCPPGPDDGQRRVDAEATAIGAGADEERGAIGGGCNRILQGLAIRRGIPTAGHITRLAGPIDAAGVAAAAGIGAALLAGAITTVVGAAAVGGAGRGAGRAVTLGVGRTGDGIPPAWWPLSSVYRLRVIRESPSGLSPARLYRPRGQRAACAGGATAVSRAGAVRYEGVASRGCGSAARPRSRHP